MPIPYTEPSDDNKKEKSFDKETSVVNEAPDSKKKTSEAPKMGNELTRLRQMERLLPPIEEESDWKNDFLLNFPDRDRRSSEPPEPTENLPFLSQEAYEEHLLLEEFYKKCKEQKDFLNNNAENNNAEGEGEIEELFLLDLSRGPSPAALDRVSPVKQDKNIANEKVLSYLGLANNVRPISPPESPKKVPIYLQDQSKEENEDNKRRDQAKKFYEFLKQTPSSSNLPNLKINFKAKKTRKTYRPKLPKKYLMECEARFKGFRQLLKKNNKKYFNVYKSTEIPNPTSKVLFNRYKNAVLHKYQFITGYDEFRHYDCPLVQKAVCELDYPMFAGIYSRSGEYFAACTKEQIVIFSARFQVIKTLFPRKFGFSAVDFSPNDYFVACATSSGRVYIVSVQSDKCKFHLFKPNGLLGKYNKRPIQSISISPSNKDIIGACDNGIIFINDLGSGKQKIYLEQQNGGASSVQFFNMNVITTASEVISLWDQRILPSGGSTPICKLYGHKDKVVHLESKGNGINLVSRSMDGTVKIWDRRYSRPNRDSAIQTYGGIPKIPNSTCKFSNMLSAQAYLLGGGGIEGNFFIVNTLDGTRVDIRCHDSTIMDVSVEPRSNDILTSSADKTFKIWEVDINRRFFIKPAVNQLCIKTSRHIYLT